MASLATSQSRIARAILTLHVVSVLTIPLYVCTADGLREHLPLGTDTKGAKSHDRSNRRTYKAMVFSKGA